MGNGAELTDNSEAKLPLIVETKREDVIVVTLDNGVGTCALHHRDALALQ